MLFHEWNWIESEIPLCNLCWKAILIQFHDIFVLKQKLLLDLVKIFASKVSVLWKVWTYVYKIWVWLGEPNISVCTLISCDEHKTWINVIQTSDPDPFYFPLSIKVQSQFTRNVYVCVFLWSLPSRSWKHKRLNVNTITYCHRTYSWRFEENVNADVTCKQSGRTWVIRSRDKKKL